MTNYDRSMNATARDTGKASRIDKVIFVAIGFASYAWVTRFVGLSPRNTDWLIKDGLRVFGGDSTTSYLGWEFFRNGSLTAWPPGISSLLGPDGGASVALHVDVPGIAVCARLILRAIGQTSPFQFMGLWTLLSFLLQGLFGGLLLQRVCMRRLFVYTGTLSFCLSPILIYRVGVNTSLTTHWVLLATLLLVVKGEKRIWTWCILGICSVAVMSYLAPMVLIIFVSRSLIDLSSTRAKISEILANFTVILGGIFVTGYLLGLFKYDSKSLSTGGFGDYSTNLVSLVDPKVDDAIAIAPDWSRFNLVPDLPSGEQHQWEGFAYLGTGLVLLVLLASVRLLPVLVRKRAWWVSVVGTVAVATVAGGIAPVSITFLALIVGLLAVFPAMTLDLSRDTRRVLLISASLAMVVAVSHRIYIASTLLTLPLPTQVLQLLGFFRVSSRMVWIVVYVVMFVVIVLADHAFKRTSTLLSIGIIVILLQVFDGSEGYQSTRDYINAPRTEFTLTSALWNDMADRYRHISFVVPRQVLHLDNPRPEQDQTQFSDDFWFAERQLWADLGEYAVKHKMSLNGFYFARTPEREYAAEALKLQSVVARNAYREDTLYVFIDAPLWNQAKATHRETDAIGLLNGVPILAPGLRNCDECSLTDLVPVKPVSK